MCYKKNRGEYSKFEPADTGHAVHVKAGMHGASGCQMLVYDNIKALFSS